MRTGPTTSPPGADVLAGVRGAQGLLDTAGSDPSALVLVRGRSGSGKSLVLTVIREHLIAHGHDVVTTVAAAETGDAVLVIDGAHTLPADDLAALHRLVQRNDRGVVVAVEPRPHDPALCALGTTMQTLGSVFDLGALTPADIADRARARRIEPTPSLARSLHEWTGGALTHVDAGLEAARHGEAGVRAAVIAHLQDVLQHLDGDVVAALALHLYGGGTDAGDLAPALDISPAQAQALADRVRASAVVTRSGSVLPLARPLLTSAVGVTRLRDLQSRLLATRLDAGTLDTRTACTLAESGLDDPRLAEFLCTRAHSADPSEAYTIYDCAILAGADADALALHRCEAGALSGNLDTAHALADALLTRADDLDPAEVCAAVRISSSIAAQRGELGHSADLYEWLGPDRAGVDAPIAATVLLAAGRPEPAEAMLARGRQGPPTSAAAGTALLADGLAQSIAGSGAVAMNSLTRAMAMLSSSARSRILPDTAPAVTALLCLHSGELAHAEAVLRQALELDPAAGITRSRHLVLSAWTAMIGGDLAGAGTILDGLPTDRALPAREAFFLHGLRIGLARRRGDVGALQREWTQAQPVVAGYSADLFGLLPLGELWLAAVRLGDEQRILHLVEQAQDLLVRLGEPALWGATLHWYGVQAAILGENPAALLPHARALAASAEVSSYAAGLAAAGRVWLRVLREEAEAAEVEAAARTLDRIGLPWDGARLAGEAALRVSDTRGATALLQVARSLRGAAAAQSGGEITAADPAVGTLTDREADVAELLVLGLTHREIGARLYIAPKTVEHHVARIRRRLGANSRSELLSMLRALGHGGPETSAS
ncbi:LuxR C-terminal-related transcriptional regulator [Prescottella equi]|uniref:LuxR C-terminal-related transcriptional regulator n=1 Tax=Rhodococcus hoagii TaxID=43767 RepID=UPI0007CD7B22|nr:LuxR C-terminal-related transcriptional regulator [Prescottella equi]MBM4633113.1 LuxR family transcriptional regulator [Prescottella equi]ORL02371.1 helix-turn-helix transcriptional regulator [Prescottella equi]UNQ34434.1 helix-turn-helix transcriptional regulator [Prescottella equi]